MTGRDVNDIKNKAKRHEIVKRIQAEKKKQKILRKKQKRAGILVEPLGHESQKPKTIESMREHNLSVVDLEDQEIQAEEEFDEFAEYFQGDVVPKICITTSRKASIRLNGFIRDLLRVFPNSYYFRRRGFPIKTIVQQAIEEGYTDIIVLNEDGKEINSLLLCHLPEGPTAHFRLRNIKLSREIEGHGAMTPHEPELVLNNFTTGLGHRIGRMLAALFYQRADFKGRRVATFHNQRDFIFFRQHRYVFEKMSKEEQKALIKKGKKPKNVKVRLQELGPQFSLKLISLQHGTFDSKHGEYEFLMTNARENETSRHFFNL